MNDKPTIYLLCGKIASGKSFYAKKLMEHQTAILLSMDELFEICGLDFFNDLHSELYPKLQDYLYHKAAELVRCGISVVLDSGFWTRREREYVSQAFRDLHTPVEWHYIDVTEADWQTNIAERNYAASVMGADKFLIDEKRMQEINAEFEIPAREEIDVWVCNQRENPSGAKFS